MVYYRTDNIDLLVNGSQPYIALYMDYLMGGKPTIAIVGHRIDKINLIWSLIIQFSLEKSGGLEAIHHIFFCNMSYFEFERHQSPHIRTIECCKRFRKLLKTITVFRGYSFLGKCYICQFRAEIRLKWNVKKPFVVIFKTISILAVNLFLFFVIWPDSFYL